MRARLWGVNGKAEGSRPSLAQQTLEERAGRPGVGGWRSLSLLVEGGGSTWFCPALISSLFPPERCSNQQWRGASWWSGTVFASPTAVGPLKPPVSEPHASLPGFGIRSIELWVCWASADA